MPTDDRPDIVLILTDQQRADVSRREGFALDTTPFMDSLADEGVWFDRAYTTSPLCSPARTSLLTGRFPSAHHVVQNPGADLAVFTTDLFGVAKEAGYATALVGKNHTYLQPEDVDHFVDFMHDGRMEPSGDAVEDGFDSWLAALRHRTTTAPTPFPVEVQNPPRIVDETLAWVEQVPADQPMLVLVSFPEPHNPYQVPEPYFSMFPPELLPDVRVGAEALADQPFTWQYLRELGEQGTDDYAEAIPRSRSNYFGMLRLIDDQVRRLHEGLEARHAGRRRVIAATADHGDFVGEFGLVRKGAEIPDVLARVPLLVHGDGIAPVDPVRSATDGAAPHSAHVSLADLMPTFCEAMGRPAPVGVQGRSLWPLLTGAPYPAGEFASVYVEQGMGGLPYEAHDVPDPMPGLIHDGPGGAPRWDELNAVTQSGRRRKVRSGDWTLLAEMTGRFRMYNLVEDPDELHDRWDDPDLHQIRSTLLEALAVWQMRAEDPLPDVPNGYVRKVDERGYLAPYGTLPAVQERSEAARS
ncbi:sulfatase-like hydrolase/transferase [Isoptericola sp. NPDC057653]|uniref:sulfatase-like hydrolase/transferase n=1 Tax=Isoptericola sp. NPDC057653 TaxID=3346195 RepID=UPI0036C0914F